MKCIYSFVVDRYPRCATQVRMFVTTLVATGVSPQNIIAHVTPAAEPEALQVVDSLGLRKIPLRPILDRTYCNKIAQLAPLADMNPDCVILCDTDLAFLSDPVGLFTYASVRAKPVDLPNPPWDILESIRIYLGITGHARSVRTSLKEEASYSTNCNGGLYIIPGRLVSQIGQQWLVETARIRAEPNLLGQWACHSDQIGFAMAMLRLGLDVDPIPMEWNFPYHFADDIMADQHLPPFILHYHDTVDENGLLRTSRNASAARSAAAVNAILSSR